MKNNIFEKEYFVGQTISNYEDYSNCIGVLRDYAQILNNIFKPSSVFDSGCAYGFLVDWFVENNIKASGCDISHWAVSHSKNIYQSSIDDIPEKDNSYELVTSTEVLEHIPEEKVKKVISELYRISNRYVVLLIALAQSPEDVDMPDPGDSTHITMKLKSWWEDLFDEMGYKRDFDKEEKLNNHPKSVEMNWNQRFFVLKK